MATALVPLIPHGVQGTAVLPALQLSAGVDGEEAKGVVSAPKSLCLGPPSSFGTLSEQLCSPALLSFVTACGECSAHLGTGGRRARGGSGGAGSLC